MLNLSKYLGEETEAWFTDSGVDFRLPETGDVFTDRQKQALDEIGIDAGRVMNIRQVHERNVIRVKEEDCCSLSDGLLEADGMITDISHVTLAVRTADCVPVFLYDSAARCIGLVHAGWKSARQNIVSRAVEMMGEMFGARVQHIKAVFGPSIHHCCFQVNQEFCDIFPNEVRARDGKWFLDLSSVNRRQLLDSGLRSENIVDCGRCTCCDERLFSYRRQDGAAGRHLSLLRLKGRGEG